MRKRIVSCFTASPRRSGWWNRLDLHLKFRWAKRKRFIKVSDWWDCRRTVFLKVEDACKVWTRKCDRSEPIIKLDGKILGKTKSKEDAFMMIQSLQGREHIRFIPTAILIFDEFETADSQSCSASEVFKSDEWRRNHRLYRTMKMSWTAGRMELSTREVCNHIDKIDETITLSDCRFLIFMKCSKRGRTMKTPMNPNRLPLLMSMAVPLMVSMLIQSMYNIVDSIFAARLGKEALTAVSLPSLCRILSWRVAVGLEWGQMVALQELSQNQDWVDRIVITIFLLAIHAGLFLYWLEFLTKLFLQMLSCKNENVLRWGCEYSYIVIRLSSGSLFHIAIEKMFQSVEIWWFMAMQAPVRLSILFDPIMIFGYFGFSALR